MAYVAPSKRISHTNIVIKDSFRKPDVNSNKDFPTILTKTPPIQRVEAVFTTNWRNFRFDSKKIPDQVPTPIVEAPHVVKELDYECGEVIMPEDCSYFDEALEYDSNDYPF
jgi:hypothetical protein